MKSNQPERVFRLGSISASVFVNSVPDSDVPEREFRCVSLQKRYSVDGESRFSSTFNLSDIPIAIEVLRIAFNHVASMELDVAVARDWHGIAERTFRATGSQSTADAQGGAK
ncbi:hypothetical protein [Mariniblastus fucicola]|uniref:Uncharacterized protein n=1 Tax=Mariniblastus fucicola TaxID=980251 RepID=A0A5B9PDC0_9BACT|nr:hypothetical protein [Mariniblastus fucicola]QEG21023.1 hypothetical protein MFFC18_08750 [Mariniblastus fucicola]